MKRKINVLLLIVVFIYLGFYVNAVVVNIKEYNFSVNSYKITMNNCSNHIDKVCKSDDASCIDFCKNFVNNANEPKRYDFVRTFFDLFYQSENLILQNISPLLIGVVAVWPFICDLKSGNIKNKLTRINYKKYMIKLANAKNYNEIHRIKIENKESAMENPKIPLVRNFYLGSQSLEKQKALLNFISYMYGEKYATNIILGPEVDVILEKILREMLTDRERHIVEFKFGLKREEEIPKEVRNMKQQSMYQIMCYQVVRKMRKKEIKDVFFNHLYKPSEEFIRAYFSKMDVFEKDSEQLSDEDKQELLNMIDVENENIGVIDEDTIEEMAIENINFSTQLLYKAMKYNGVNTVGDLLEKARSKKDLLTMAYIGNKEAEEIIEKLSELGITIYNGVKTREKIGLEIKSLNLSHRSYMVLARNEIHTVEQLVERIKSKDDLLQLRWIGETTANEIIEKLAENGITIYKDENEEAIKIALSKLRIQQEKMQELDANILYLKKQREVGEQLENQSKGEDDNGR